MFRKIVMLCGADVFGGGDYAGSQVCTDLHRLVHGFAVGQTDGNTCTERIACSGGIFNLYVTGRTDAFFTIHGSIDGTSFAHGYDHGRDICFIDIGADNIPEFFRRFLGVVIQKQDTRFQFIANKTIKILDQIPAFCGNTHIGDQSK